VQNKKFLHHKERKAHSENFVFFVAFVVQFAVGFALKN